MAAPQDGWATVINDLDDASARLILRYQLEDLQALQQETGVGTDGDEQAALQLFKEELEYHRALRMGSVPPSDLGIHESETDQPKTHVVRDPHPAVINEEPASEIVTFPCEACGDRFDTDHCWQAPCKHRYCDDDLSNLFRSSMTTPALYPPRCCRQPMPFDDVQPFLQPKVAQAFAGKKEELDEMQPTYCHVPTCSTYLGQSTKEGAKATCPTCHESTCVLCRKAVHDGDCKEDEAAQETEALAQKEGWQRCIDCKRFVELNFGCHHMT